MTIRLDIAKLAKSVGNLPGLPTQVPSKALRIGLVNNMPDGALLATEQQFSNLVSQATSGRITLELFYLPSLARGEAATQILEQRYFPVTELYRRGIDALIVTGNEPRTAKLDQEPYWQEMTALVDWARFNTASTFWSCLAAHAVVLHLDKIERQRLSTKLSGAFRCEVRSKNVALPKSLMVCHSRLNEVPKSALEKAGYEIISESVKGEVDTFMKFTPSRFLFLQGHPEYSSFSLAKEYRRDVERYLNGGRDDFPAMPENYFDKATTEVHAAFQETAKSHRTPDLMANFPSSAPINGLADEMASSAAAIFAYWMKQITEVQEQRTMRQF